MAQLHMRQAMQAGLLRTPTLLVAVAVPGVAGQLQLLQASCSLEGGPGGEPAGARPQQ